MHPTPTRPQFVCQACCERLEHRLMTLHAEDETIILCQGAWESLPQWMRDAFTLLDKKGRSLGRRREAVREISDYLKAA